MLTRNEILRRLVMNESLPQDEHPEITEEAAHGILEAKPELVNAAFESAIGNGDSADMANAVEGGIQKIVAEHGWFPTSVIMAIALAGHYQAAQVPKTPNLSDQTRELLQRFADAARTETSTGSEWTIPVAMLVSLGEEKALKFLCCMVLCAGFGISQDTFRFEGHHRLVTEDPE